jgi:DnaJ-class molecular chaperone
MDYYKVLQIDQSACPEVVQKAYKALSLQHHPDKHPPARRPEAAEKMQQLNRAYAVLSDPALRQKYDDQRQLWDLWLREGLVGVFKATRDGKL